MNPTEKTAFLDAYSRSVAIGEKEAVEAVLDIWCDSETTSDYDKYDCGSTVIDALCMWEMGRAYKESAIGNGKEWLIFVSLSCLASWVLGCLIGILYF